MKNVIISRQGQSSENYERFLEIVKRKNIKVLVVKSGDKVFIEKDIYFDILFPEKEQIEENILNNNSIVAKLVYKDFSMLFTGDIEEIAEKALLNQYEKNLEKLNATILKVPHHGSKTSSTQEFLNVVKPRVALIGVGKNNTFGHPNDETLERFKANKCEIFRTDLEGEITVRVNRKGMIWFKKMV